MTGSTLQIDQEKLFAACNHDSRLMAIMLVVTELISGERVVVKFAHPITNGYVEHYRKQLLESLGILPASVEVHQAPLASEPE